MTLYMYSVLCIVCFILYIVFTFQINIYKFIKTDIEKLKEGFRKFHYEAEFVKESKQGDKK